MKFTLETLEAEARNYISNGEALLRIVADLRQRNGHALHTTAVQTMTKAYRQHQQTSGTTSRMPTRPAPKKKWIHGLANAQAEKVVAAVGTLPITQGMDTADAIHLVLVKAKRPIFSQTIAAVLDAHQYAFANGKAPYRVIGQTLKAMEAKKLVKQAGKQSSLRLWAAR